jgi:hypothetical protein
MFSLEEDFCGRVSRIPCAVQSKYGSSRCGFEDRCCDEVYAPSAPQAVKCTDGSPDRSSIPEVGGLHHRYERRAA